MPELFKMRFSLGLARKVIVLSCLLTLTAKTAHLEFQSDRIRQENEELAASQSLEFELEPFAIESLLAAVDEESVRQIGDRSPKSRLLMFADGDHWSDVNSQAWQRLLDESAAKTQLEVWLVNLGDNSFERRLRTDHLQLDSRFHALNVSDAASYKLASGLAPPLTILLDEEAKIEVFVAGRLDSGDVRAFVQVASGLQDSNPKRPFL